MNGTKIVVVGDCSVDPQRLEEAVHSLKVPEPLEIQQLWWGNRQRPEMQKQLLNIEVNGPTAEPTAEGLEEAVANADYLFTHLCPLPRSIIEKAKQVKLIGTCRGGMEQIDVAAATENNIPVMHVIRNAEATSDFALGLLFAETRNIARSHAAIKNGVWQKDYANSSYTTSVRDMQLGVVGLGHIGRLVAQKARALGMRVAGYDPYVETAALQGAGLGDVPLVSLEELFRTCDVVSLHMRVTKETENMIGKELLGLMKPTAYLINTSRAKVLQKDALVQALQQRSIGGAAIDVFWDEPILPGDPLLELDNITMTSHMAGNVVDALPKSPLLLVKTVNAYLHTGHSDMIVNRKQLNS